MAGHGSEMFCDNIYLEKKWCLLVDWVVGGGIDVSRIGVG